MGDSLEHLGPAIDIDLCTQGGQGTARKHGRFVVTLRRMNIKSLTLTDPALEPQRPTHNHTPMHWPYTPCSPTHHDPILSLPCSIQKRK